MILTELAKWRIFRFMGWLGFFLINLILLFVALLTVSSLALSVGLEEGCRVWDQLETTKNLSMFFGDEFFELQSLISDCIFGDGHLERSLNISEILGNVSSLNSYTQNLQLQKQLYQQTIKELVEINTTITNQQTYPETAAFPSAAMNTGSYSNPRDALEAVSSWADYSLASSNQKQIAGCSVTRDNIFFNTFNCTQGYSVMQKGLPARQNIPEPTCVIIDTYFEYYSDVSERYTDTVFSPCTASIDAEGTIASLFNRLHDYSKDTRQKLGVFMTELMSFNSSQNIFAGIVKNTIDQHLDTADDLKVFLQLVVEDTKGLQDNLDCSPLQKEIQIVKGIVCFDLLSPVVNLAIGMILLCITLIIIDILAFVLAPRIGQVRKEAEFDYRDEVRGEVQMTAV